MPEHADTLSGLYGLREAAPGLIDLLAALALGLLLAGLIGGMPGLLRAAQKGDGLAVQLSATRALPAPDRVAALAGILRDLTDRTSPGEQDWVDRAALAFSLDREMLGRVKAGLYTPGSATDADPEALERAVACAMQKAGG